ncbi:hypothetical protein PPTG_22979 [Phytophthora nicotianae INRA-310]|uniref:Uncharacterized protein n=1 Tax=Phytophthora nicotianae (strain INRA-310) TaxID=761204 RepID=W2Q6P9_PHYN3|nr:hypothetical protein PPTG_22979 [Phytophthora nicotianae INRA-310]ETN08812.1 hypothetical protein PPTG_22979 [Phytophthora nicotianae INRA-310]
METAICACAGGGGLLQHWHRWPLNGGVEAEQRRPTFEVAILVIILDGQFVQLQARAPARADPILRAGRDAPRQDGSNFDV